ncbi:hypothetical protein [Rhizorhabdus argentea]|uniref:hypothetical protein n=1 Tax=Rhizorhabdus argentea TaxID=1387174 RepID=UPI0030EB1AA2
MSLPRRIHGCPLTDEELEIITLNLLIGGLGMTQGFVGSMVVHLARNPDHRQQLIDNPAIRPGVIDEMLRYYAPG